MKNRPTVILAGSKIEYVEVGAGGITSRTVYITMAARFGIHSSGYIASERVLNSVASRENLWYICNPIDVQVTTRNVIAEEGQRLGFQLSGLPA
jgi:hypothetical protein